MPQRVLVYGSTGYIGGHLARAAAAEARVELVAATARLEDRAALAAELDAVRPDAVINAAGLTGRPNIDWCETHQAETIRVNVVGMVNVIDVARERGVRVTMIGSGCVYSYDDAHPLGSGIGFTEADPPNFRGSFYVRMRHVLETLVAEFDNVLHVRVRLPLSDDGHERSLVSKLLKYDKLVNIPNSVTIIEDFAPIILDMTVKGLTGKYNMTNPGTVTHNEIMELYRELVDPSVRWSNFSLEEQAAVLVAERSNNELDVRKLLALYPDIRPAKDAVRAMMKRLAARRAARADSA